MAKKDTKVVKKSGRAKEEQTEREIIGVCFIALALFLGAGIYTDLVGVIGTAVKNFCFGMFGIAGYAVPVILAGLGVLSIVMSKSDSAESTLWLLFAGVICLLVIIHAATRSSISSKGVIPYYSDAYLYGKVYLKGGGLLGALLAYPSLLLLGPVGTYIFFGAAILIVFLVATRLSIRAMGEKVGSSIRSGVETVSEKVHTAQAQQQARRETYDFEEMGFEQVFPPKKKSMNSDGKGLYTETLENGEPPVTIKKKRKKADDSHIVRRREDAVDWEGDISFMPQKGALPKRNTDDDDPFDILSAVDESALRHEAADTEDGEELPVTATKPVKATAADVKAAEASIVAEPPEYVAPPITRLKKPAASYSKSSESPAAKGRKLEETLASFNIQAKVINHSVGPVITRFELQPAQGVRVNRITSLSDDIALALAAPRVRIEAPIPGKSAIGIEIPNRDTVPVLLREVIESPEFREGNSALRFGLGKDIAGNVVCADLDKMPHLLIAGSTGSGKSVCVNDIILSFAYGKKPEDVRLILIDPKQVELRVYSPMPHLLMPVVTDPKKAAGALKWAVMEMDQRYLKMSRVNARSISRYNSLQEDPAEKLPRLVIIIDELADLMMVAAKDVEESICRIAQLGRAAGIHLIVATQRPSTDIITGLIKANIPSRIALAVSSAVDSRVILDTGGAEKLLGKGDMLFHANGAGKPVRTQCAFVSDEEVEDVMDFFASRQAGEDAPKYAEISLEEVSSALDTAMGQGNGKQEDDLLDDAVKIVLESGQASISMIQRRLRVGYARAARLIDIMEQLKVVSGFDGSKPRKLLIGSFAEYQQLAGGNTSTEE
ncbi:MAG: DNA translocase FtsK 4TM domain-containing protein [Clostridia bacterium]|nr:DNA translocase FtsK 4TM domain-containing protein [Clostridia bacterium]